MLSCTVCTHDASVFCGMTRGERVQMVVTSVLGHLHEYDFVGKYRGWGGCRYIELFEAPIEKQVSCREGEDESEFLLEGDV